MTISLRPRAARRMHTPGAALMLATVVATVLALGACGADAEVSGGAGGPEPSSTTTGSLPTTTTTTTTPTDATEPIPGPAEARAVLVVRRGGIRPTPLSLRFAAGEPPPGGFTSADAAAVLRAAGDPELRTAEPPTVGSTCCDQYVYTVSIQWRDGRSRSFTAVQGAAGLPALARLLHLVESPTP